MESNLDAREIKRGNHLSKIPDKREPKTDLRSNRPRVGRWIDTGSNPRISLRWLARVPSQVGEIWGLGGGSKGNERSRRRWSRRHIKGWGACTSQHGGFGRMTRVLRDETFGG